MNKVAVVTPTAGRGCWVWIGAVETDSGYGRFHIAGGRHGTVVAAHRWSLHAATGITLDTVAVVRHVCDERFCVNPAHLLAGTQADNIADQRRRGRSNGATGFTRRPLARILELRAAIIAGNTTRARQLLDEPGVQLELHLDA